MAISIGQNLSTSILSKFTENVLRLKQTTPADFKRFFKWITASIKVGSERVAENDGDQLRLPPCPDMIMDREIEKERPATAADENFAVMLGKCSTTKRPYLLKFARRMGNPEDMERLIHDTFFLVGSYTIDEEQYRRLSDPHAHGRDIKAGRLAGAPNCPCCGNDIGLVVCGHCGHTLCASSESKEVTCPWCASTLTLESGDSGDFEINRTIG